MKKLFLTLLILISSLNCFAFNYDDNLNAINIGYTRQFEGNDKDMLGIDVILYNIYITADFSINSASYYYDYYYYDRPTRYNIDVGYAFKLAGQYNSPKLYIGPLIGVSCEQIYYEPYYDSYYYDDFHTDCKFDFGAFICFKFSKYVNTLFKVSNNRAGISIGFSF